MDYELGEIMFERDYEVHNFDGSIMQMKLLIGKPQLETLPQDEHLWYCPHQVTGFRENRIFVHRGEDPLDAFIWTLKIARLNLESIQRKHKRITWLGRDALDFGLPCFD